MIDSQIFNQQFMQDTPQTGEGGKLKFAKTYLFYGQTPFLSEENAQVLVSSAKQNGFPQREIFYIDNRTKFQPLFNSLNSPGLFDPNKILELRFDTEKPSKKIGEQIATIAQHNSANIVIIQAVGLNYKIQKEAWFSDVLQASTAVRSKLIDANQLPNWIHQRATHLALQLETDALKTIMRYSEGNLLWTNQILMQLSHSDYPQPIQVDVVKNMLADFSIFYVDDLTQALLNKRRQALKITQKLQRENESLVLITGVLFREFDALQKLMQSGQPFAQACKQLRIWSNKQRGYQAALSHYSPQTLTETLRKLAQLDKINKGQHKGDGWLLLTRIVSDLVI